MFHPTAYENFKIIVEGSVYDADFSGEIIVIDRSEQLDLAVLSRRFEITYTLSDNNDIKGSIVVRAPIKQLAAELNVKDEPSIGAFLELHFSSELKVKPDEEWIAGITGCLQNIWGIERDYQVVFTESYLNGSLKGWRINSIVSFRRLVTENQAEDLYDLVPYGIRTLKQLDRFLNREGKG